MSLRRSARGRGRSVRGRISLFVAVVLAAGAVAGDAGAHTRSRSFSSWQIAGERVTVLFSVQALEATRLALGGTGSPDAGADALLLAHVRERLAARRGPAACEPAAPARLLAGRAGYLRVELTLDCPGSGAIEIANDTFFDVAPSHIHVARINDGERPVREFLFTASSRRRAIAGDAVGAATVGEYVMLGVEHILAGVDHLAFLLCLLLLCRNLRQILWMVTGFTVGHSVTLALAVLGLVRPDTALVEALIGFTIALVAVENVAVTTGSSGRVAIVSAGVLAILALVKIVAGAGPATVALVGLALFAGCYLKLSDSREAAVRLRPALTVLFGLVHGFGFAGVLMEIGLPPERRLAALFGFNVGVEIGQLLIVALLAAALTLVARVRPRVEAPLVDLASAALCGLGLFWFFARAYA